MGSGNECLPFFFRTLRMERGLRSRQSLKVGDPHSSKISSTEIGSGCKAAKKNPKGRIGELWCVATPRETYTRWRLGFLFDPYNLKRRREEGERFAS